MAGSLSYMQTCFAEFFLPSFLFFSFIFLFLAGVGGGGGGGECKGVRYGLRLNLDKLWLQRLVYGLTNLLVIFFFFCTNLFHISTRFDDTKPWYQV